jgi:hypothetical protein
MPPQLSNLQFFIAVVALVIVAILAVVAIVDIRRRRRTPPFLNYFYSNFDSDQWERDNSRQSSFSGVDEWRAYNRSHADTYEMRSTTANHSTWD